MPPKDRARRFSRLLETVRAGAGITINRELWPRSGPRISTQEFDALLGELGPGQLLTLTDVVIGGGTADLSYRSIQGPVRLFGCRFEGPLRCERASFAGLALEDCDIPALDLRQSDIGGPLDLSGLRTNAIDLAGAKIEGDLTLSDAQVGTEHVDAIDLSRVLAIQRGCLHAAQIKVSGGVVADLLQVTGGFRLDDATIARGLKIEGARLAGNAASGWVALDLDRTVVARIAAGLTPEGERLSTSGAVSMQRSKISGASVFSGASLNRLADGPPWVFDATRSTLGDLRLDGTIHEGDAVPFEAAGEVRLVAAVIEGSLDLDGARLVHGGDVDALVADELEARSVFAADRGHPLMAEGAVRFIGARIAGAVDLDGSVIASDAPYGALALGSAHIAGELTLRRATVEARTAVLGPASRGDAALPPPAPGSAGIAIAAIGLECGSLDAQAMRTSGSIVLRNATFAGACRLSRLRCITRDDLVGIVGDGLSASIVDLSRADLQGEVLLVESRIAGALLLGGARIISGAEGRALSADRARFGDIHCASTSAPTRLDGEFRLPDANVDGEVDLRGVVLNAPASDERLALFADGLQARQINAEMSGPGTRTEINGQVSLARTVITGPLSLAGARIRAPSGLALNLERASLGDLFASVSVDGAVPFDCAGEVRLASAQVDGAVDFSGARLVGIPAAVNGDGLRAQDIRFSAFARGDTHLPFRVVGETRLIEAQVTGAVVLAGAELAAPGAVALLGDRMKAGTVLAADDTLGALHATGQVRFADAEIDNELRLDGAVIEADAAESALLVAGATIRRDLSAQGAQLTSETVAIEADRITAGAVRLDGDGNTPTRLRGGLSLSGCVIRGQVVLDAIQLDASDAPVPACNLRDAVITDDVLVRGATLSARVTAIAGHGMRARRVVATELAGRRTELRGMIEMPGATVEHLLDLSGAAIETREGAALVLDGGQIRDVVISTGASSVAPRTEILGEVRGVNVRVDGGVDLEGARITAHDGGDAVSLDRAALTAVWLGEDRMGRRTEIVGRVRLNGAAVRDELRIVDCDLSGWGPAASAEALVVDGASAGELILRPGRVHGRISLLGVKARRLRTDPSPAGLPSGTDLAGLGYDRWDVIEGDPPAGDWQLAIVQSHADHASSLQPYDQMAATLRGQGEEQAARRVLLQRERRVTAARERPAGLAARVGGLGYRAGRLAYSATVGYGYRGGRSVVGLLVLWWLAIGCTVGAAHAGDVTARSAPGTTVNRVCVALPFAVLDRCATGSTAPVAPPVDVNAAVYGAERVLPAVDFGERARVHVTGAWGVVLALITVMGWVLTIALLAALNKTLRRD